MPLRVQKPMTPGQRGQIRQTMDDITTSTPKKSLLKPLKKRSGRNHNGRITVRHRGGGHKRRYRVIDFKRDKPGVQGEVASIEYDPNRSSRIALIKYPDGDWRYILAPNGLRVGDPVEAGERAAIRIRRQRAASESHPRGYPGPQRGAARRSGADRSCAARERARRCSPERAGTRLFACRPERCATS